MNYINNLNMLCVVKGKVTRDNQTRSIYEELSSKTAYRPYYALIPARVPAPRGRDKVYVAVRSRPPLAA